VAGTAAIFTQIAYSVDERVATIVLDREDRLNAFTPVMREELIAAFDRTDADDEVRALVITGRGRAFCAGADLGGGTSTFDNAGEARKADIAVRGTIAGVARDGAGRVTLRMARSLKPIIAAVNGAAVGAGVTLTLAADVRLASATAKFGFVFARRGIVPEGASTWFLPRLVGVSKAMEWIATGRIFGAEEALEGRLVSALYEPTELLEAAGRLAREIADTTSSVAVALARQMLWSGLSAASPWDAHRAESKSLDYLGRGPDAAEGVASFLEKRPPKFPLRVTTDLPDVGVGDWPAAPPDAT
jgi:enoyl-CoA hydratase/carnithine racemase